MSDRKPSVSHSSWLRQTRRLFPHPLFAGCVSVACFLLGILFAGAAIVGRGTWFMAIPSLLFLLGSFATAAAAVMPGKKESKVVAIDANELKPTFAILVLLIGVYSWLLTIGMTVFQVLPKNGPEPIKYYVTLGIAISSLIFMQFYGKRIVREHFGAMSGRKIELSGRQVLYVTILVLFMGIYFAWLMV